MAHPGYHEERSLADPENSSATVRFCQSADLPAVRRLARQTAALRLTDPATDPVPIEGLVEDQFAQPGSFFYVAEQGAEVVGFACGRLLTDTEDALSVLLDGEQYLQVDGLCVRPTRRTQSVAWPLLDRLMEAAQERLVTNAVVRCGSVSWQRLVGS